MGVSENRMRTTVFGVTLRGTFILRNAYIGAPLVIGSGVVHNMKFETWAARHEVEHGFFRAVGVRVWGDFRTMFWGSVGLALGLRHRKYCPGRTLNPKP